MSKRTNRDTPPRAADPLDDQLARILDAPVLARVVPHLAAESLHRLIEHRGLDACGELVAAATPAQLTTLLDLDLWRHARAGRDDQFDVDRFGEWLEVLVDAGEAMAARTVAALDARVVVLGLSRYVRIFDPGTFEPTESTDDEPMDRHDLMNSETSADVPECEVGGYLLRARRPDAWDAIVTLLVTLDAAHPDCFHALMQGCRRLSNSRPETDGLDDIPLAPEQHGRDVAIERERRQSRRGYATPAEARAFLEMARQSHRTSRPRTSPLSQRPHGPADDPAARGTFNPIVTAYFRALENDAGNPREDVCAADSGGPHQGVPAAPTEAGDDVAKSIEAVLDVLSKAGMMPQRPRALLGAGDEDPRAASLPLLRRRLEYVLGHDEATYLARTRELAFLANTLLAGCLVQARPFTPQEASDAAAAACNLGLECWPARWPGATPPGAPPQELDTASLPDAFLVDHDLVTTFEVGWSVLHEDVSLFVADQLGSALIDLDPADPDILDGVRALRRTLAEQRRAGTPWRAREAADVLALVDMTAWVSVRGLLDECPVLPDALRAVLERRTTPVSATAFEFISTMAQIADIRRFTSTLRRVLTC